MRASSLSFLLPFIVGSAVVAQDTLDSKIKALGREYFGTAADKTTLSDASYEALVIEQFGAVTPENSMKWDATEPSQNSFSFDGADYLVDWAETNNKKIRGHTLVWHSQLPSWVSAITDAAELTSVIENHVTTLVSRYAGKIYAWDVVNEIFNEDGTLRDSVFSQVLGDSFVSIAFNAAAAADPNAKLYINDYNLDYAGAKVDAMVSLVTSLLADGVQVDGVGSQGHLILNNGAIPYLSQPLQALADVGVDVAITELDIRMPTPANETSLADQQANYEDAVGACVDVSACVGVTVWGVTDKYSWVPDTFSGYGAALLYDEDYAAKPALDGALAALS